MAGGRKHGQSTTRRPTGSQASSGHGDEVKPRERGDDLDHAEPIDHSDEVTEAGIESFPASDPPAFNQAGPRKRTNPRPVPTTRTAAQPDGLSRTIIIAAVVLVAIVVLWIAVG
jgi:hypothetical protein